MDGKEWPAGSSWQTTLLFLTIKALGPRVAVVEDQQRLLPVLVRTSTGHVQLPPLSARCLLGQPQKNPAGPSHGSSPESKHCPAAGSGNDGAG